MINLLRILQATVVVATICCYCVAQASVELACSDPKLAGAVRRISKIRFETRGIESDLVRCQTFVQLIREQLELAELSPGLAIGETTSLLTEIARILEFRASCPSQLMGGLGSLHKFAEDCRLSLKPQDQAKQDETEDATEKPAYDVLVPGTTKEIVVFRSATGKFGPFWTRSAHGSMFVSQVWSGTPAARAGLRFGDQLIEVNGRPTAGKELSEMIVGLNAVRLLVRSRPMEQNFVIKPKLDEQNKPSFAWFKWTKKDMAATRARAGILEGFKLIAVNGESVVGMDGTELIEAKRQSGDEFTLTFMPQDFYERLTYEMELDAIRIDANEILADVKAHERTQG